MEQAGVLKEISRRQDGKKIRKNFELTKKGMMRAVKLCVEKGRLKKLINEKRLIIFDIPEKQRFYRDYFRQLMKDLGCQMIQLSVWQADFELPEDFLLLVGELGLSRKVIIYKVRPDEVIRP
ncbi:MAG: CRISPR-associated endonuclease Cas2 [bacterium]|nr:CRISPR-associated endonuclease Cas2 [bacterium]